MVESKKIVFVKDWGAYLRVKNGLITCSVRDEVKWSISPVEISSIVVLVSSSISTDVIRLSSEYGIDLVFFKGREPVAKLIPASYGGSLKTWARQLIAVKRRRVDFARQFIYGKLHNQWVTLRYYEKKYGMELNADQIHQLSREVLLVNDVKAVMEKEAEGARIYWRGVKVLLPRELKFRGRKKRGEARDLFNVSLNIGYSMLRKTVLSAVISAGLNPYWGFLHTYRSGRASLVFDLMEEFRSPFVDRKLIGLARKDPKALEDRRNVYGIEMEEEEIYTQARKLANSILHGSEYTPYISR